MAEIKRRKKKKQPKNSCFLGCFGFSDEENSNQKLSLSDDVLHKKRKKWFSWGGKQRSSNRKVVADAADVSPPVKGKRMVGEEIHVLKGDKKLSTIRPVQVNAVEVSQVPAPVGDQVVEKANKTKYDNAQEIILEKKKTLAKSDTIGNVTWQEEPTTIRKSTTRRTLSHPASQEDKPKPSRTTAKLLSHSLSFPPPKSVVVNDGDGQQTKENMSKSKGRFDSLVGMSILLITLMIMLFWGKLCAIVCTSAWFYFVPRFTSRNKQIVTTTNDYSNANEIEINSEEYKKKVVLEGLLQRNHRNGFVI